MPFGPQPGDRHLGPAAGFGSHAKMIAALDCD
jgi:hypothetical protein